MTIMDDGIDGPCPDDSPALIVRMAEVQPKPVWWLWNGRIALGKLTLVAGDPGLGKSFLTLDLAARVSRGLDFPDCCSSNKPAGVILLSAEDDPADTIRPRLDAAGADVRRVYVLEGERVLQDDGEHVVPITVRSLEVIKNGIDQVDDCRLLIVDPISAFLGKTDSHVNAEVRAALSPLAELAARRGVAVVAVTHLRKGEGAAVYRAMGSLAFTAAARAVWAVTKDRNDPDGKQRLFLPVKNNLATDTQGLAFTLEPTAAGVPRIRWEPAPVTVDVDEALSAPKATRGRKPVQREAAENFLLAELAGGPRLATELLEEAGERGIARRTLERAREELGVISFKQTNPGPNWWKMPQGQNADVPF